MKGRIDPSIDIISSRRKPQAQNDDSFVNCGMYFLRSIGTLAAPFPTAR